MRMKKGLMEGDQLLLLYPIILFQLPNMNHELRVCKQALPYSAIDYPSFCLVMQIFIFTMPLVP